jgi:hypothetical protein
MPLWSFKKWDRMPLNDPQGGVRGGNGLAIDTQAFLIPYPKG